MFDVFVADTVGCLRVPLHRVRTSVFLRGLPGQYHKPTVGLCNTNIKRAIGIYIIYRGGKEEDTGFVLEFWCGEVVFVCEGHEAFDHEGFLDIGVCAGVPCEFFEVVGAREIDDGDMAGMRRGFERFDGGVALYAGHFVIHEDEVGIELFDLVDQVVEGIETTECMDLEIASFEDELTDKQVVGVVVDENNFGAFHQAGALENLINQKMR